MKRPSVAIDCDDVLVPTASFILNYYNNTYHTKLVLKDLYSNDPTVWDTPDNETAVQRVESHLMSEEYQHVEPFVAAIEVVGQLREQYDLHIITGRPDFLADATKTLLDQYFPDIFSSVEFTNFFDGLKSRPKSEVCQALGASFLIDDHLHHALGVAECGIDVLLFGDYPWNQADHLPNNVRRVRDWHEVAKVLL